MMQCYHCASDIPDEWAIRCGVASIVCDDCIWESTAKRNWYNRDLTKEEWKSDKANK